MRKKAAFLIAFLFLFGFVKYSFAVNPYCATPPFIQSKIPSNIMLVLDYSGSMGWDAYSGNYDSNKTYYGYFIPNSMYKCSKWSCEWQDECNCDGYWYIDNSSSFDNSNDGTYKSDHGYYFTVKREYSGNVLNWFYMERIDILRWILTGGMTMGGCVDVKSCDIYSDKASCEANPLCKWRNFFIWHWCSNKSYCSSLEGNECSNNELCSLGESVVVTHDNIRIKKEDVSSYNSETGDVEGILQQIRRRQQRPRIGAAFFSGSIIGRVGLSYEYVKLINKINDLTPNGATCTKCAVDEMEDLFSENSSTIRNYNKKDPYKWGADNTTVRCAKNFVLLMSDGEWNTCDGNYYDKNPPSKCDPVKPINRMWKGGRKDLVSSLSGEQNVKTYSVAMFLDSINGKNALKWMAVYGNYNDLDNNGHPCNRSHYPNTSLTKNESLENSHHCNEVKKNKDKTGPYGYFQGDNPEQLKKAIVGVFAEILKQAASGTACSILSEKKRVNAGIIQAVFYPEKIFSNSSSNSTVKWAGALYDWWFYSEESGSNFTSNMREDTIENKDLDICGNEGASGGDYIMEYDFDNNKLHIKTYPSLYSGEEDNSSPPVIYDELNKVHHIMGAGEKLREINIGSGNNKWGGRKIYTVIGDLQPSTPLKPSATSNMKELKNVAYSDLNNKLPKLFGSDDGDRCIDSSLSGTSCVDDNTETDKEAKGIKLFTLKKYIYGKDYDGYRSRETGSGTWKLGDIIYSTPKIVNYDNYTVTFIGANDGMLHAFQVGKYSFSKLGPYQASKLRNDINDSSGIDKIGKELWAFIPKNALPYLRFLSDPDYCHLYYVDMTPYTVEFFDKNHTKHNILIGGMRLGGAAGCDNATLCVNPPKDTCPDPSNYEHSKDSATSPAGCLGLSSYFALDVSNPTKPKFLWEFSDSDLGFSYSGPAFITIKNGEGKDIHYVMFLSGPTNYEGDVGQDLRVFVLKLNEDMTIEHVYKKDLSSKFSLGKAFGGRLFTNGIDSNNDGVTDMVFFGLTASSSGSGNWYGNVIGVKPNDLNPSNWDFFKLFNNNIGPVTVPISYSKCFGSKFIYFGTGRYFYKGDDSGNSDSDVEKLYGVKIDKCLTGICSISSNLYESDSSCIHVADDAYGWYQTLNPREERNGEWFDKERDITETSADSANKGYVFFTTTEPTSDICGFGGDSRMWGLNCATGESLSHQSCESHISDKISGTMLLQTSVGQITKFDVDINPRASGGKNPFTEVNNKATNWVTGTASPNKTSIVEPPTRNPAKILYEIEH